MNIDLKEYGLHVETIHRNLSPARLYEEALRLERGSAITAQGALAISSGEKTGRSPKDKHIVRHPDSESDIWWGKVNKPIEEIVFRINHERGLDYLNTRERLYVFDGFAGWDPKYRIKVRVICSRAYHALFMHNMLMRPSEEELANYGEPDYVIINAGRFPANRHTERMTSTTSIDINLEQKKIVILGTEYAGEMKKGVFTVMNYTMPKKNVLSMHCSANEGKDGDVTIFFGLSGTGKTTLSTDPHRALIGDDEHCWSDDGVFNIEGGCYAKCIDLSEKQEPDIFHAIRFGSVVENVVYDPDTHVIDFSDSSYTANTRVCYPINYIDNAKVPCVGGHPKNVIFLTCDAFGVLPPVSKLTPEQAMYHFISGYTAKVAGTEEGVNEPEATFSACFGAAFMVWHPSKYAELLADKMKKYKANVWLINTGWSGGPYGVGKRMPLEYTRAIIDAVHDGSLDSVDLTEDPVFGFQVPNSCPGVPTEILQPKNTWSDAAKYDETAKKLAGLFHENFEQFSEGSSEAILSAAPKL